MLDKTNLQDYRTCKDILETVKDEYRLKMEIFEKQNEKLLCKINETQERLEEYKIVITEQAKEEYETTSEKKLLGGIGIRIVKILTYDGTDALTWAKKHDMALCLDKKIFEKIAKTQPLSFVNISEDIKVTFPKEIIYE